MKKLLCFFIGMFLLIGSASAQCIKLSPDTIWANADGVFHHYTVTFPYAALNNDGQYALEYQFKYDGENIPEDSLSLYIRTDTSYIATNYTTSAITGAHIANSHGFFPSEPLVVNLNFSNINFNYFYGAYLSHTNEKIRFSIIWLRPGDYTIELKLIAMTGGERNNQMVFKGKYMGGSNATPTGEVVLSTALVTTKILSDTTINICYNDLPYTQGDRLWTAPSDPESGWGAADNEGKRYWQQAVQFFTNETYNSNTCYNRLDSTQNIRVCLYPELTTSISESGHNTTICQQTSAGYAMIDIAGGKAPYSIQPIKNGQNYGEPIVAEQMGTNIRVGGLSEGGYTFAVTDANGCTAVTGDITIAEAQQDNVIHLTANPSHVTCYGGDNGSVSTDREITTGVQAAPYIYVWSNQQSGEDVTSITGLTAGDYSVTVTDNMGCTATASVTITEAPAITHQVEVTCCNYDLPYHFDQQHADTVFTEAGTKEVKYTSANGCDSIVSVTLTVNTPAIALSDISGTGTICKGGSTTLSVSPIADETNGDVTYAWTAGNTTISGIDNENPNTIEVSPEVNTTYTVVATATLDNCTATDTKTFDVTVNAPAVVLDDITGTTTICKGEATTLTIASVADGTNGTVTYVWNTQETESSITVEPDATTEYSVVATALVNTNDVECTATATQSVTVTVNAPAVQLAEIDPITICKGGQGTTLTVATIADGTNGELSYAWSASEQAIGNSNSASIDVNPEATTTYSVVVTATVDDNDVVCTATATQSVTVTVNAPAVALNDIEPVTICKGGQGATLTVAAIADGTNGELSYAWSAGNTAIENSNNESIDINPEATTTYSVVVTATVDDNDIPCTATATKSVEVTVNAPAVQLADIDPITICKGEQGTTLTVSAIADGTNGDLSYVWSAGNTTIENSNSESINVNPEATTTYSVVVTATVSTNDVVCTATATQSVTVTVNAPAVALSDITGSSTICAGSNTTLSVVPTSNTGTVTYAWTAGEETIGGNNNSITVTPAATTEYTVVATATVNTNDVTCTATDTKSFEVTVNAPAVALGDIAGTTTICKGNETTLSVEPTSSTGTVTYAWSNQENGNTITVSPTQNTTYIVTATATVNTNNVNCTVTDTKSVSVTVNAPAITMNAISGDTHFCLGGSTQLTASTQTANGDVTYAWSPATYLNATEGATVTSQPTAAGTIEYVVTGTATVNTNNVTCTATATQSVTVTVNDTVQFGTEDATLLTQSVCAGSDITPVEISYVNATITHSTIPAGMTYSDEGNTITLAGAPTTAGEYTITLTAASDQQNPTCAGKTLTFNLNVNPTVTLSATHLTQSVCAGSAIQDVEITNTNSTVTTSELPAGLQFDPEDYIITGAPTTAGTYEVIIMATSDQSAPQCAAKKDTLKLTVNPTVTLEATNLTQSVCAGSAITNVVITNTNSTVTTSELPAGLQFDPEDYIITGAPTTAGTYEVIITATSDQSAPQCAAKKDTLKLTVNPTVTLSATNLTQSVCAGNAITSVVITNTNSTVTTSELPAGLTFSNNTIAGAPTTAGTYAITITATSNQSNPTCNPETVTFNLTVNPTVTLEATNLTQTVCAGSDIANVVITNTNSTVTTSELPEGLTFSNNTIVGAPTTAGTYAITITATSDQSNPTCEPVTATFNLTVNPTVTLSATNLTQSVCAGSAITNVVITNTNSTVTTSTLPAGLTFSNNTIAGTPTTAGEYTITITATSNQTPACSAETVTFNLTVKALPTPTLSNATICASASDVHDTLTLTTDANMSNYTWSVDGGTILEGTGTNSIKVQWAAAGEKNISITYTGANGCVGTNESSVTVYAAPEFTVTGNPANHSICAVEGSDIITINSNTQYGYEWSAANGLDMEDTPANNAKEFKSNTPGSYSVTLMGSETHDNLTCQTTHNVTVTVNAQPTLEVSLQTPTCNGYTDGSISTTVTGGATPYQFEWSNQSHSNNLSNLGADTYSVTVTDANGCHAYQEEISLTEPEALTATRSNHVDADCHGASTGSFTVAADNGVGTPFDGGQYLYKLNDDQVGEVAVSKTYSELPAGNYVVTISDMNGCSVIVKDTIREPEELTAGTISGPESTLCYNTGTTLTGATEAAGGNGTITYKWQILNDNTWTDIDNATNGASYSTGDLTSTTQYRRAATNQCGTVYTEAVTVNVYPDVTAGTITAPAEPICYNTNTTLNATVATNGNGTYTYQWQVKTVNGETETWTNIENANDQNYTTENLTATTTFRRVDTSCGRTANTNEVTVSVYPDVTAGTITAVDPICYNTNATLNATVATNGNGTYTYQWQSKSGNSDWANIENANDQNYTANNLTVTTSFRRVDTSCGRTANTNEVTVTVYDELTAGAITAPASTICYNASTTLEASAAEGGNGTTEYKWQKQEGEEWTDLNTFSPNNVNYTTENLTDTTTFRRAAQNDCGTVYTEAVTVNVHPALAASDITGGTNGICIGQTHDLSVTVTSGSDNYSYEWEMSATSEEWEDAVGTANAATYAASIEEPGTTYYRVIITDNCDNHQLTKGPVQVTVWEKLDVEDLDDQTVCKDAVVTLTATATGGNDQYTYAWYKDSELISGATTNQYTPSTATAGSEFTYKVVVTDNCENSVEKTATITVYSMPVVSAGEDVTICVGTETELTASAENGKTPYTYQWFKGNTSLTGNTANDITYTTPAADATAGATTTYKVVVTDACGNTANDEVVVSVNAALTLTKSDSTDIICHGQSTGSITVTAANGAPNYQYKVDNGSYGEATDQTIATFSELAAGSHTVTVKDNCGTETSVTFVLREPEELALAVTDHSDLTCNGNNTGSITVTASNGTANYQYKIDNENYGDATAETTAAFSGLAAGAHTITVMDNCGVEKTASYTLTEPDVLTLTESADDHQDVSCYNGTNGSVTVNVTGGTSTYQYKVGINGTYGTATAETSFTYANRPAEKDTLYVKDANGCEASIPVEITQPEELTLTENETLHKDITCNGDNNGEITVIAAGGTGTYLYNWDNTGNTGSNNKRNLTGGEHTIVVTDQNTCTATLTVTIEEPDELTATIEGTNISCYDETDGTITVSVSGGTEPYTYRWNDDNQQNRVAERTDLAAGEYTVTVTDGHYCSTIKNITLTQPANFTVTVSGDNEICAYETTTFTATTTGDVTLKWYLNDNEIANQTSATLSNINTAGTYKVVATQSGSNCTKEATITLTVDTVPNVTITGESSICYNTEVTLTANHADSYVWGEGVDDNTSVTNTLTTDSTFVVTGTNSYGCTASASHTVTVNALPDVTMTFTLNNETVTPNNSEIDFCADGTLTLSVPDVEGNTYTWYGADELLEEDGHSLTLTNATPEQTGWYYVKVTNANGCDNQSGSTLIVANPLPNVVLSEDHNLNTICADSAFHFTVTCEACTTAVSSYVWKLNDDIITGASTSTLRATEGGTYVVTATDENGCVKTTDALPVTVNELPTVTLASTPAAIDGIALICDGQTATLTATSETNSFSWEKDRESIEGSGNTLEVTEEGKYTVSVTDNNGCSNTSDTITVYVNPLPNFIFGVVVGETGSQENETNVCRGTEVTLIATQMQDAETYTYTWSTSDYLSTTGNTRTFSNEAPAGTYTISVTATSELTGCSQTLSRTIIVHELPTITVANAQVCLNGTVALSASGAESYVWTPASYFMAPNTVTDVVTGVSVTFYGTEAGEKSITITGTDEYGCVNTTTATVNVLDLPTTGLTLDDKEICQGASTSWTIENGNYNNYVWASSSEDALTANGATATFTSSTTGTHSVTVTVTDNNNCTNSSSAEVMVHALPTPTLSSDNAVCQGNTITFTTDAANADNGIHDYIWTYPETNATVEGETTGNTLTLSWSDNGTKTVTVNYTDGNGCTATQAASRSITVNALPDVVITNGQSAAICLGGTVNLNAAGATSYEWANEAGNSAAITVEPERDSTFTVTGTDDNGCSNTAAINITVYDTVKLTATNATQTLCLGTAIEPIALTTANCTLDFGQMSEELAYDAETHKITGRLTSAGVHSFTITATSEHGCSSKSLPVFITMNDTVKLAATNTTQTLCLGTAIEPIALTMANCELDFGQMPTSELTYDESDHVITGELSSAGEHTFTITASSTTCPSTMKSVEVSITMNDTARLVVTNTTQELCLGEPIADIVLDTAHCTLDFGQMPTGLTYNAGEHKIKGELENAGTYTFTITASNNCGNKTADVSITMMDTAKLTATNTTQTLCLGAPITPIVLDTANCDLDFTLPTGLTYNEADHQIEGEIHTAGAYNFTITANSDCGEKSVGISITMNDTVKLTATNTTQTLCLGEDISIIELDAANCSLDFGQMPTVLTYSDEDNTISGRLEEAQEYTFTITASSTTCPSTEKSVEVSITMNDTVKLVALSPADNFSQKFCQGNAMTALNFRITNSDDVELTGAPAGVTLEAVTATSATEPNYVMSGTPTETGTFNFTITASSEACEASVKTLTGTIVVDTIPAVTITTDAVNNTVCEGETITLTATTGYEEYTWNNEVEDNTFEEIPDRTHYEVTVTNGEGCSNTAEIEITINALPTVTISEEHNLSTICADSAFHFAANCATAVEYVWKFDNEDYGTNEATLRATEAGVYSVIVTDENGCSNQSSSLTVNVNALPEVTTEHENVSCTELGSATVIVTTGIGEYTCAWNGGTPEEMTIMADLPTLIINELSEGTYTYVVTDLNSCSATGTVTIENPGIITGTQSIANNGSCEGADNTVTFSIDGGTADYTIEWVNVENGQIMADTTNVTDINNVTFNMDNLARGDYRLAMVITDTYGCHGNATDTINLTVWPSYHIVREINIGTGDDEYTYQGVSYTYPDQPEEEHLYTANGCDSIISYVVTPYGLEILVADTCYLTRSSYTREYANIPGNLIDTIYVKKDNPTYFYAFIENTDETMWNEEKIDMSYELLFNEESINNDDMPNLVSNFSISTYYDRSGHFYGINDLDESTGEIPSNTFAFRQTANSTIMQFDYFYFAAFKNIPNKVTFTGLENGTYTLKLKAELRIYDDNADIEELGINRNGIFNPYIVNRRYGHLLGGFDDMPIDREVIAARTFTIIVNEDGVNPSDAPAAINEYGDEASVKTFPNPVNDQLNLVISGMEGNTQITITDAQGKLVRVINAELNGGTEVLTYSASDFAQGIYFLNVRNSEKVLSQKFIVTKR